MLGQLIRGATLKKIKHKDLKGGAMTARIVDELEADLARRARRVLPAAGFGNVTFDIIIREGT